MSDVFLCPLCGGSLRQPDGLGYFVCENCGWEFVDIEAKTLERTTESRQLSSPGLIDHGLGTSQRDVIHQFHQLGKIAHASNPKHFDGEGFLLSLHDLWDRAREDSFWIKLTECLKDKGISEDRIAIVCAALRQEIRYMNRKRTQELRAILRRFGIDD